jgi:hypothetical protein
VLSPAVCVAYHVLRSLKLPSVALYIVETTFARGFESYSAHDLFNHLQAAVLLNRPTIPRWARLFGGVTACT